MKRMILAQMVRALKETLEVVGSNPTVHSLFFLSKSKGGYFK